MAMSLRRARFQRQDQNRNKLRLYPPTSLAYPQKNNFFSRKGGRSNENERVQNNPQFLNHVKFDCFFQHPHISFDQTSTYQYLCKKILAVADNPRNISALQAALLPASLNSVFPELIPHWMGVLMPSGVVSVAAALNLHPT